MTKSEALSFLEKLTSGKYARKEHAEFLDYLNDCDNEEYCSIMEAWEEAIEKHERQGSKRRKKVFALCKRIVATTAAFLIICPIGVYFAEASHQADVSSALRAQISTGGDRALLRLEDGREILLEDTQKGGFLRPGGLRTMKTFSPLFGKSPTSQPHAWMKDKRNEFKIESGK